MELLKALVGAYFPDGLQRGRRFFHFAQPIGDAAAIESGHRLDPIGFLRSREGEFCGRPEHPAREGELWTRLRNRPWLVLCRNILFPIRPSQRLGRQPPVLVVLQKETFEQIPPARRQLFGKRDPARDKVEEESALMHMRKASAFR